MLAKRIIACLDVREGKVVKGVQFRNHEILGDILSFALRYRDEGADELVFYDITASADRQRVSKQWVSDVARILDIPFCVAGGIRSVDDAAQILAAGADKISINSPAIENPDLINELADRFGRQCVVVGVDSIRTSQASFEICCYTGRESTTRRANRDTFAWLREAQARGAGEVVLNCMDRDGTGSGFDIEQLQRARKEISIPLVASGGARTIEDFRRVFEEARVDAALAAGAFHRRQLEIPSLKQALREQAVEIRL